MKMGGVHTHGSHKIMLPKMGDSFTLAFFGDVHFGCDMFCESVWSEFEYWWKHQQNVYGIGMGDYTDVLSTSERQQLNRADFHDQTVNMIESRIHQITDQFCDKIEFMRDRLLWLVEGNHYGIIKQRMLLMPSGQYMATKLGTEYAGCETLRRLQVRAGHSGVSMDIACHHGKGGGTSPGGAVNPVKAMRDIFSGPTIFAQGHNHAKGVWSGETTRLNESGRLVHDTELYIRTGSFLKSREHGVSNYNVDACRPPTSLGWVSVKCTVRRDTRKDGKGIYIWKEPTLH